jgi:hypothetical protein
MISVETSVRDRFRVSGIITLYYALSPEGLTPLSTFGYALAERSGTELRCCIAARMMRRILVDHARRKRATKRAGFSGDSVPLSQVPDPAGGRDVDVLALHEALSDLAELDPRQADIVELRYFGGLKIEEVAAAAGVSMATVKRELTTATAWLRHRMRS